MIGLARMPHRTRAGPRLAVEVMHYSVEAADLHRLTAGRGGFLAKPPGRRWAQAWMRAVKALSRGGGEAAEDEPRG